MSVLSAGSLVAGYRIERVLGVGGMGAVYLAANPTLPRFDALKVLCRCTLIPGSGGLIPHHWCVAPVGRYMVKAVARQLDTAHKLIAAQYHILTP